MFIDTSAFVAIFCKEPEAGIFANCIERAQRRWTSPMVRLETCMVLASRLDRDPADVQFDFDEFLTEAGINVVSISDGIGRSPWRLSSGTAKAEDTRHNSTSRIACHTPALGPTAIRFFSRAATSAGQT